MSVQTAFRRRPAVLRTGTIKMAREYAAAPYWVAVVQLTSYAPHLNPHEGILGACAVSSSASTSGTHPATDIPVGPRTMALTVKAAVSM